MSKKRFKLFPNILIGTTPYSTLFPEYAKHCSPEQIDSLHRYYCHKLGVPDILKTLTWRFEKRFRATLGQAEYWDDEKTGETQHLIRYATNYWIPLGPAARKNLIAHEVCHLAVEKLFGHGNKVNGIKVNDHGYYWKLLMFACDEDPKVEMCC